MFPIIKKIFLLTIFFTSIISFSIVESAGSILEPSFTIEASRFTPRAWNATSWDMETVTNNILVDIIDSLIISFWVLSLLVMVIWWGYMIIYSGQEELLSKWKKIFMAGIISLVIALLAWMIVSLVRYLLYN